MTEPQAIGYTRVSQEGMTIERQKEKIAEYCSAHDLQLERIYDDGRYESGYNEDREAYEELKEDLDEKPIEAVVVRDVARIGRDFDERMDFILTLRQTDIELHSSERGPIDLSDPYEAAVESIHAASDHADKQREIRRSKEAIKKRIEKGYDHGRPRFGMTYDEESKYQVPGEDFETVMEILKLRRADNSYPKIAAETGVAMGTVRRVWKRREWYIERTKLEEEVDA